MIVVIDIGNSAAKIARLSEAGYPEDVLTYELDEIEAAVSKSPIREATLVVVGSSGRREMRDGLVRKLDAVGIAAVVLEQVGPLPFINGYAAGQAGIDRLANVAAAIELGRVPVIVVDVGSAITVEVVGPDSVFRGGAIFPGIRLQAESLHAGTAGLPHVAFEPEVAAIGCNTKFAILSGILNGCAGGIERLLRTVMGEPGMAAAFVVFTGGDGGLMAGLIERDDIAVVPGLTLRGLYLLARQQFPDRFT